MTPVNDETSSSWLNALPVDESWIIRRDPPTTGGNVIETFPGYGNFESWSDRQRCHGGCVERINYDTGAALYIPQRRRAVQEFVAGATRIWLLQPALLPEANPEKFRKSQITSFRNVTVSVPRFNEPELPALDSCFVAPSTVIRHPSHFDLIWKFPQPVPVTDCPLLEYLHLRKDLIRCVGGDPSVNPWWLEVPTRVEDVIDSGVLYDWKKLMRPDPLVSALVKVAHRGCLPGVFNPARPNLVRSDEFVNYLRSTSPDLQLVSIRRLIRRTKSLTQATAHHTSQHRGLAFPPLPACRLALASIAPGPQSWDLNQDWKSLIVPLRRVGSVPMIGQR
jgi:hypothetical protein